MNPLLTGIVNQAVNNNPQVKELIDTINKYGGDPKTAFYSYARENNLDPNEALRQARQQINNFAKL